MQINVHEARAKEDAPRMTTPACTLFSRFGILLAVALAVSAAIGADRVLAADPVSLPSASPQQPIKDRLEASAPLVIDGIVVDRALLVSIYAKRAYAPVWIGHPERGAEFLAALERALADGIDPESLGASAASEARSAIPRSMRRTGSCC